LKMVNQKLPKNNICGLNQSEFQKKLIVL
jgi:hypothetical protein